MGYAEDTIGEAEEEAEEEEEEEENGSLFSHRLVQKEGTLNNEVAIERLPQTGGRYIV